ncbi:MAG: YidC/Oxa1 family membrane protein insertase, partial [Oscillospiraceae bacterium]
MLQSLWNIIAIPLGYIMRWCYLFVTDIINMPMPYVFALFLFTVITKVILFPLAVKQQKSTAKMSAFQPIMADIQKTYAKDKNRQQQEMVKLQEEMGYNPMAGCLPMLIQFPILFGLIEVIYRPLTYMLKIPAELVTLLSTKVATITGVELTAATSRMIETGIIEQVKTNAGAFTDLFVKYPSAMQQIQDLNMSIGSINLWENPKLEFSWMLLIPLFSVVTMLLSQIITLKASGQDSMGGGSMKMMTIMMSVMFAVFSFMYPAGFSLYWGFQNIVLIFQSMLLRKMIDPDKYKAAALAQMEENKKNKKKKAV